MSNFESQNESDEQIIQAVLAGDHDRFSALVIRHDWLVRKAVGRCVSDPYVLEDAVQETWCVSFRKLGDLVNPRKLTAWLTSIATNCAREQRRKIQARVWASVEVEKLTKAVEAESDWLWELVAGLPKDLSQLLIDHYRDGLSYEEIATRQGIKHSTVRGRIYIARQELKRKLGERK